MKIILLCALFAITCAESFSQKYCEYPQCRLDFLKNKLYVVQTGNKSFDSALQSAVSKYWTVSEIGGYISESELKKMRRSSDNSFLHPLKYNWYDKRMVNRVLAGLFFFQGNTAYMSSPSVESFEAISDDTHETFDSCIYRIELMVLTKNNQYKYFNSKDSIKKIYNLSLLKKKILLINEIHLNNKRKRDKLFDNDAFTDYPYKVLFTSSEKIGELIKGKDKQYILGVPIVSDAGSSVNVYDLESGFQIGFFDRKGAFAFPIRAKDIDQLVEKIAEF